MQKPSVSDHASTLYEKMKNIYHLKSLSLVRTFKENCKVCYYNKLFQFDCKFQQRAPNLLSVCNPRTTIFVHFSNFNFSVSIKLFVSNRVFLTIISFVFLMLSFILYISDNWVVCQQTFIPAYRSLFMFTTNFSSRSRPSILHSSDLLFSTCTLSLYFGVKICY